MARPSHRYQSQTIHSRDSDRYIYLPLFPTASCAAHKYVLLANVPGTYIQQKLINSCLTFPYVSCVPSLSSLVT